MALEVGLEPTTHRLTADCSTIEPFENMVGMAGFEPTTSCSQDRRASTATTSRFNTDNCKKQQKLASLCYYDNYYEVNEKFFARLLFFMAGSE